MSSRLSDAPAGCSRNSLASSRRSVHLALYSASRFDGTSADHLLFFVQRQSSLLPLALLNSLAPATATATIASNYLRAEAAALLQVRQFLTEPIAY